MGRRSRGGGGYGKKGLGLARKAREPVGRELVVRRPGHRRWGRGSTRPTQGPDGCSAGCARAAGAQGSGCDQCAELSANPPAPRARPSPGVASSGPARSFSPAGWPQRRPFSSISQPRSQLHPPPGRMRGWRRHRHRRCRRLRASRSRRSWGAEAQSPSCGGRRPLRWTPRPGTPPAPCTLTTSLASLCAGAGCSRPPDSLL